MAHSSRSSDAEVSSIPFGNIRWFTLTNATGVTVKITNFGAIITSIVVPDRDGKFADVALGYDRLEDYINGVDKPYFGAIVGRFANRIAQGRFALNGQSYALNLNNGSHHLHGGIVGFDKVVWDARPLQGQEGNGVRLRYLAKDREEGYPGNLQVVVTYRLNEANELMVDYEATTDQATPVNLTQHTYFNLQGEGTGTILNHELQIRASKYTPIQANLIPTGEIADVAGTPLDFRQGKPIGRDLSQDHEQLRFGLGYD
ncbi:MAG TPA: aldose epimerase family protein, partial [Pirellulaceae bacterium]